MRRRTGELVVFVAAVLAVAGPASARAASPSAVVDASVDRTELAADERLTLTVRVESPESPWTIDLSQSRLPFEIVSRSQSRQASLSLGGGSGVGMRQTVVYSLVLAPRRTGELVIPPVVVTAKGVRHESAELRVKVLPAGAGPRAGAAPDRRSGRGWRGWERDLVLELELDRREAFLGEQVTASVWLLSPVGVVAYEGFKPPLHDGFWAEELESPQTLDQRIRNVNGVPTRAYLIQKLALFPTRAGTLTIEPFQVDVALRLGGGSPFDPFPEIQRARRQSAAIRVEVKPLPQGAPPGFQTVNVGSFALTAELKEAAVAAGEPVTVRVTATGEGNVRAIALPPLPDVPGTSRFEPAASEQVAPRAGRYAGARTLETVLVPRRAGALVVPPLEWPTFDPRAGRYVLLRTPELRVEVGAGAPAAGLAAGGANRLEAGLRPIRSAGVLARAGPPPWSHPLFALLLALPVVGYVALAASDRLRLRASAGAGARRGRDAGRAARRRLGEARRRLARDDREAMLASVEQALLGYASDRLGASAGALTREALLAALAAAGARPPALALLAETLDATDAARFGGGGPPGEALFALAERAVAALEEAEWAITPPGVTAARAGTER